MLTLPISYSADDLRCIGFVETGKWQRVEGGRLEYKTYEGMSGAVNIANALYAFVYESQVLYIGKTTRSIRGRFVGYTNPGKRQATNRRCNQEIQKLLDNKKQVEIWSFTPGIPFQVLGFDLNIAAGLEDALIAKFNPPWNGRSAEDTSDLVEFGDIREPEEVSSQLNEAKPISSFTVTLGNTYFNTGFINPGVDASIHLAGHGADVKVLLGSPTQIVHSTANRTANGNGSIRLIGNNTIIKEWFQRNFRLGDKVNADIIDQNTILLRMP